MSFQKTRTSLNDINDLNDINGKLRGKLTRTQTTVISNGMKYLNGTEGV